MVLASPKLQSPRYHSIQCPRTLGSFPEAQCKLLTFKSSKQNSNNIQGKIKFQKVNWYYLFYLKCPYGRPGTLFHELLCAHYYYSLTWPWIWASKIFKCLAQGHKIRQESQNKNSILHMDGPAKFPGICTCPIESAGIINKKWSEKLWLDSHPVLWFP